MTKSRKREANNKIKVKNEYLIDKRIYYEVFFIGNQKVVLFHKFKENGWMSAVGTLSDAWD
jgi:hypothetical protein